MSYKLPLMPTFAIMFQRLMAFVLLVLHINGSMLLPQVEEHDIYYDSKQVDDINSIFEYIEQEVLDIPDDTPEDEDDDRGQDFRMVSFGDDMCEQKFRIVQINAPEKEITNQPFDNRSEKLFLVSYDILTPPPKA